ncbi:ArsR/SmtB family transcription factor [Amycolatopsis australiensis]|uniref:DNA-binding transcriptional regulator, ArsR family n=1 Tax=Amycolatopsis australiensis TaxID=546364 RepID=A0A1K1SP81_9PSEU|nr:metalloregulator ArsR/SmtB family transcription factor [Amycolatopsis australiensis]SFW86094.1 DNA-binding transcriptional regulator, ArsR family [Amycolatopsis australiensis]
MGGLVDPGNAVQGAIVALTRELADPVRLTALQVLAAEGPHTMVQLADALGVTAPRLGNHLARLRAAGLVTVEHAGRHAVYRVGRDDLLPVLTALARYGGNDAITPPRAPESTVDIAHTCYDHTAGRLGVAVFAMLVDRGALRPPDGSAPDLTLGDDLTAFHDLGVDPAEVHPARRRLATACLDRTNRIPHLGGVLGHEVLAALLAADWVRRGPRDRELRITPRGRDRLGGLLPGFEAA